MPPWVASGFREYAERLPRELHLELHEVPGGERGRGAQPDRPRAVEGERLLRAVPRGARVIALDGGGRALTTRGLADALGAWFQDGRDTALLVGGAEGLDPACLEAAESRWSLSGLTLPHMLVRVVVAEQLYRAWAIRAGHPYHR